MKEQLQHQSVIAHVITMVRCENDDSVLCKAQLIEPRQDPADGIVDHRDHPKGQGDDGSRLVLGDGKGVLVIARVTAAFHRLFHSADRWQIAFPEGCRQLNLSRVIHVPIATRWRERVVRVGK